ncbi:MAG: hypothetical protein VW008_02230, partial [Aquiluna sp.]
MADPKTQVVFLGRRKLVSLQRKKDAVQVLGLLAVWVPILAFSFDGGFLGLSDPQTLWSAMNRLSALIATSLLIVHIA